MTEMLGPALEAKQLALPALSVEQAGEQFLQLRLWLATVFADLAYLGRQEVELGRQHRGVLGLLPPGPGHLVSATMVGQDLGVAVPAVLAQTDCS